jgi:hypothetical protein
VLALAFAIGLVCIWGLFGWATLALYTRRRSCQNLLLAPAVGLAVTLFPAFWLNRAGLPVARFGPALTVGLVLASAAVILWRRPPASLRHFAPFGVALLVAGLLTGHPLLTFGFDWLSHANGDMANYALMAVRLLNHGFADPPAPGTLAALLMVYPEVTPFFALAAAAYLAQQMARRQIRPATLGWLLVPAALVAIAALNRQGRGVLSFLLVQARWGAMAPPDPTETVIPYFLIPSGLAQLWGLQAIGSVISEPRMSLTIALGAVLLLLIAGTALRLAWRGEPVALIATVMLAVGIRLFAVRAPYGLLKLAMYAQPFLLGTLAIGWLAVAPRGVRRVLPLLLLGVSNLLVQLAYVNDSRGSGAVVDVRNGSALRINAEFRRAVAEAAPTALDLDTPNLVLSMLPTLYRRGTPSTFLGRDFFLGVLERRRGPPSTRQRFILPDGSDTANEFSVLTPESSAEGAPGGALALTTGQESVFNRRRLGADRREAVLIRPYAEVSNHLVFVHSRLGQHYYAYTDWRRVGLFRLETDPLYPGRSMAGLGRHLLLRIVNPSPAVRLATEVTASLERDGDNRLPPATLIGTERAALPLVGRGSARVFSAVLTPQQIAGHAYLAIDMGVEGHLIPIPRTGLMNLYGRDVAIDARRLVVFTRDVSPVTDEEYATLTPPTGVARFPEDLANPSLEYSGLYEDGWLAEHAYVNLTRPAGSGALVIQGGPPPGPVGPARELVVLIDGHEAARRTIAAADFSLRIDAPPGPTRSRIDLVVSAIQRLPSPDNRPVGLRLRSIAFER